MAQNEKTTKIDVVNFHITNKCNYRCGFCFMNKTINPVSLKKQFKIIDNIKKFFNEQEIINGRITFAGGEPLLYKNLYKCLKRAQRKCIITSVITNGSMLTENVIKRLSKSGVQTVGISVDSLNFETNGKIGRCCNSKTLSCEELIKRCDLIKKYGMKVKINSTVTALNYQENLAPLLKGVNCDRFKIFQARKSEGQNDKFKYYASDEEFQAFCERHFEFKPVIEKDVDMENSYVVIYPDGSVIDNKGGEEKIAGNILNEKLSLILPRFFNYGAFIRRYQKHN